MRKIQVITIILILAMQLAMAQVTLATHSATIAWVKTQKDDPSYPLMPGAPDEYFWNGITPKWINFTVTNNGPDAIKEIKLVFEKYPDGSPMFNFSQTSQSKAGWYATPDEFGPNKRPTVLYFRTDSEYIQAGETVTFGLLMTVGPEECRHNIDVWTVDAGATPSTNFYELWMLIDQHNPSVQITAPANGTIINGQNSPAVTVRAHATDLEGPHLSHIKNVTLDVEYDSGPQKQDPVPKDFLMKYDPLEGDYYWILSEGSGLIDQFWHTCTVKVFDYAENGPVYSAPIKFFWFTPTDAVHAWTTDPCFLYQQATGHVGGNAKVVRYSGFKPYSTVTATLGGTSIGQNTTNTWGQFELRFIVPEKTRNFNTLNPTTTLPYKLVLTDDSTPPITAQCDFTIIPWMSLTSPDRWVNVGEEVTVKGTGFAGLALTSVFYRDVSLTGTVHFSTTDEWSDYATHMSWTPYLDNLLVAQVTTDGSGTFTKTFTVAESYGGMHPVFGQEVLTGVRSGWVSTPMQFYPESAFVGVMTKIWTEPTIGLSGQYIKIFATGLPLPEYHNTTYDCRTTQTTEDLHNWTLALDFGPNKYWVFEKGFILNNEFDLAWSMQLYLPFAYWYNHQDPTSLTWNGSLYWKDYNGNYHLGSQFLKVPALFAGNCTISLYEFNRQTDTDEKAYLATTDFTVLKDPLYVRASSGTLYFSGERVTAYAEVDLDGIATNPTAISFQLYHEDAFLMSLTPQQVSGAEGLYTATFTCPPQEGNYFIKVTASKTLGTDITLSGFGVTGFVVNPTLEGLNATLTTMNNGLATVNTSLGTITLDLSEIRGNITDINGKLATINTTVGSISTDISTINGKIVSLNDNIATIQTTVGTFKTSLDSIGATVTATGADTVTIKTAVGDIQGKITSIDSKTTNIETSIGQVSTSTESIKTQTGLQPAGIGLSLVGALAAIIAAVLIFRKLYK